MRHVGKRAIPQLVIDGEWFQPYKPGRGLLYDELHAALGDSARLSASSPYNQSWFELALMSGRARSSPLIERYTRPAMGRIWTEENKYRCWLRWSRRRARCWPKMA
jgi:hypothetical protein